MIKQRAPDPTATRQAVFEACEGEAKAAEIGERIGRELRAMFEDVVAEPVPEKFRALLEKLERKPRQP